MDQPPFVRPVPAGLELRLKVVPGASRSTLAGTLGDRLKVRIAAPPEGGKANKAVLALISDWLGDAEVQLVSGQAHAEKTVLVLKRVALTPAEIAESG
jgi:uncharacterized protein (TIGR00251 family)